MFQLELLEGWIIHNVFNKKLVNKVQETPFSRTIHETRPPPDIINEKEEYEVEEIRKHRR